MAALTFRSSISLLIHTNNSTSPFSLMFINLKAPPTPLNNYPPPLNLSSSSSSYSTLSSQKYLQHYEVMASTYRYSSMDEEEEEEEEEENELVSFDEAVALFNKREYYKCHDYLESLWNKSQDPTRTLVHGILQCAVGFHHLFNQNHNGAMMELGEGLCKLRKMNLETGPFYQFEIEISVVLDFIYQTQLELAACSEDLCVAMDQSEASYKLLGGYASGQHLYCLETDANENVLYIVFCPPVGSYSTTNDRLRVKLPTLHATQEQLMDFNYT